VRRRKAVALSIIAAGLVAVFLFAPVVTLAPIYPNFDVDVAPHYRFVVYRTVSASASLFSFGGVYFHGTVYTGFSAGNMSVPAPYYYILTWDVSQPYQYLVKIVTLRP